MYLAYIDDSGNSGALPNGSESYVLGCILVEGRRWPDVFDDVIGFRRFLKEKFGIPVRAEMKANYLIRNGGPYFSDRPMSEDARRAIYRGHLRLIEKLELKTFAVVINKADLPSAGTTADPRHIAWEFLLQRLERFSTKNTVPILIMHDEGETLLIKRAVRKARRAGTAGSAFGTGMLTRPARLIVDDPVPRQSGDNYFIQMADLAAYAAFRFIYKPGRRVEKVVPQETWEEIGAARLQEVSSLKGGPSGLVVWPKKTPGAAPRG
jgi:hypothetical protein